MDTNGMKTFDWDDVSTISEEEERGGAENVILPDGKYPFEVIKVEKAVFDGSAKIPQCNMAKVFLRIDGGDLGTGLVVENLYLVEKQQWKAAAFLRAIGLKKHGEDIQWRKVVQCDGEKGRCEIYVDEYDRKDGKGKGQSNKLRRFLDKEGEAPKKAFKKGAF